MPTPHLRQFLDPLRSNYTAHLVLAHLIERDKQYTTFYRDLALQGATIILDNSAFEMYKSGLPMYPTDQLIEQANKVGAKYVVMSDYPDQPPQVTIESAQNTAPQLLRAGFGTFFCPQSEIGDLQGLLECFDWGFHSPLVDYIGFSILNIPNAYGVERNNKLQRYLSRYKFVQDLNNYMLKKYGKSLEEIRKSNNKLIHFLGMTDGPNEIDLINSLPITVATWDSSAAVWAGLNGKLFDKSPTGLVDGKFEKEVDFNFYTNSQKLVERAQQNILVINDKAARAPSYS